jgi:hypothetical protein
MKCKLLKVNCHKNLTPKTFNESKCEGCRNFVADTIIRKWTTQGSRTEAMEKDIVELIKNTK